MALLAAYWSVSARPSNASTAQILLSLVLVASWGSHSKALAFLPPGDFRAHVHLTTYPTRLDLFLLCIYCPSWKLACVPETRYLTEYIGV